MALCGRRDCGCALTAGQPASSAYPSLSVSGGGESNSPWDVTLDDNWAAEMAGTPWYNVTTFYNGWVMYDPAWGYPAFRRVQDRVELRGLVKNGVTTTNTSMFLLPVGFRPVASELFPVDCNPNAHGRVNVRNNGIVSIEAGSAVYLSLSTISFSTVA